MDDMLGFRATQAGTDNILLTAENNELKMSSVTNSQRLPTNNVVSNMLSGKGIISYRSPPTICSTKSASRVVAMPRGRKVGRGERITARENASALLQSIAAERKSTNAVCFDSSMVNESRTERMTSLRTRIRREGALR
jgi:hypothetical protein